VATSGAAACRARAVDLEHRVAADDDAVEVGDVVHEGCRDVGGLASREQQDVLVGRQDARLACLDLVDDRLLVDVGRPQQRLDAGLAHEHESGGGGGGEAHAHAVQRTFRRGEVGDP
jgi:hypothetical protein